MLRLLVISILLVAVNTEHNVDEFVGNWLATTIYPKFEGSDRHCHWFNFKIADSLKCTCGNTVTPVMKIEIKGVPNESREYPFIIIGETEDAESKLKQCICNGIHKYSIAFKKINAEYFVGYFAHSHGDQVDYSMAVFVNKVPRLAELQALQNSVPDLRGKDPGYLCPLNYFA